MTVLLYYSNLVKMLDQLQLEIIKTMGASSHWLIICLLYDTQ